MQNSISIRTDLTEGHYHAWQRIAQPGTWWTGTERLAIAAASRSAWDCLLCDRRKEALSPEATFEGLEHSGGWELDVLSPEVIDTVHRLTRDQARLSREWLERLTEDSEMSRAHYVELVGVVTQAVSIDTFHLAIGIPLSLLPEPVDGEPSRYSPPGLAMEQAWVPMIKTENLGPDEQDLYQRTGNVIRALSAVPDEVRALKKLSGHQYLAIEQMVDFVGGESVGRSIDRAQMELIAGRTSALHECFY